MDVSSGTTTAAWFFMVALVSGVHAQDTTPPNVTCDNAQTDSFFVNSFFGLTEGVTYTYEDDNPDPSGIDYNVTRGPSGDLYPPGLTPVTLFASDTQGNTATCLFFVENPLTELPVICPDLNRTVPTDTGQPTYSYTPAVGPADISTISGLFYRYHGGQASVDPLIPFGTNLSVGTHQATLVIYDDVLNKTCTGYILVQDTENPNVTCPGDITEDLTNVIEFSATAVDNVGASLMYYPESGSRFNPGMSLVTVTAQDQAGLNDTCNFWIEIAISELPVECPEESTIQLDSSESTYQYQPLTKDDLTLVDETYQFYGDVTVDVMANGTYNYTLSVGMYILTIVIDDTTFNKTCLSVLRVEGKEPSDIPQKRISTGVIVIITCGLVLLALFLIGCIVFQVNQTSKRRMEESGGKETYNKKTSTV